MDLVILDLSQVMGTTPEMIPASPNNHTLGFDRSYVHTAAIRGAVAFALALRFDFEEEKRNVIITSTLVIVLFTTIIFGGGTMPLLKCLQKKESSKKKKEDCQSEICLIKTEKLGEALDAEEVEEADLFGSHNWFLKLDENYLKPFFTRKMGSRSCEERKKFLSHADTKFIESEYLTHCHEEAIERALFIFNIQVATCGELSFHDIRLVESTSGEEKEVFECLREWHGR
ncbi:hypothetical protein TNCV_3740071 [Trichonephila clavipes]|nr:hypothetical protein TNCV_3740071 [Trichonephila clavipes]